MTTIAWKPGVLAADRQATDNSLKIKITKVVVLEDVAIGFAGNFCNGMDFVEWWPEQDGKCPLKKKTSAIVMSLEDGTATFWEYGRGDLVEDEMYALGSGRELALGAMEAGASPQRAVEIAARRDANTGMGIQIVRAKRKKSDDT